MKCYHGSYEENLTKIENSKGDFFGVFGNSNSSNTIGNFEYIVECDDDLVLDDYTLNYDIEYKKVVEILRGLSSEVIDAVLNKNCPDCEIFTGHDIQKLRSKLAYFLGYAAVEVFDEFGTTYIFNELSSIRKREQDEYID